MRSFVNAWPTAADYAEEQCEAECTHKRPNLQMSYRRRETSDASLADQLPKTKAPAAVSSIWLGVRSDSTMACMMIIGTVR